MTLKLIAKGTILSLPKKTCEALGLVEGSKVDLLCDINRIVVLQPATEESDTTLTCYKSSPEATSLLIAFREALHRMEIPSDKSLEHEYEGELQGGALLWKM